MASTASQSVAKSNLNAGRRCVIANGRNSASDREDFIDINNNHSKFKSTNVSHNNINKDSFHCSPMLNVPKQALTVAEL